MNNRHILRFLTGVVLLVVNVSLVAGSAAGSAPDPGTAISDLGGLDLLGSGVAIEYRPSLQTQHLGLFGSLTVVAGALAYWIYRTRRTRGAHLLAVTLVLLGLRTASDVVHGLVGELWTFKTVLVAVNPLLELCVLVTLVRFAGRYAGVTRVSSERTTRFLAGLVVGVTLLVATNPFHGLVFTAFHRVSLPFAYVGASRGMLGYALIAMEGTLLLVAAGLLAHAFTSGVRPAWWPATVLALAVSQAGLVVGLQLTGRGVLPQYAYGAISLGGFVFLTTLALFDHGLRRIERIALATVVDELDDAVVFLDDEGLVVDYNRAAAHLFRGLDAGRPFGDQFDDPVGVSPGPGTTTTEVTLETSTTGPKPAASVLDSNEAVVAHGTNAHQDATDREAEPQTESRDFLVHTTRIPTETDELLGYTVRFVDVTELKERSRELRRKNDQLDQFASTVSHDLRNPLTVASGYLEFLSESAEDDEIDVEQALTYLDKVGVSLDRMNAIIEDILALIEHADPVTDTDPVEYHAVTRAAWETVDTGNATLTVDSGGRIEADADRLQRLLENLFRNAIDHVGGDVTIETGLRDGGFFVADDGPGIPDADADQIFEQGYTTAEDGTGLGLSIVDQLAAAHGWEIELDPDHDGTRFVVSGCETMPQSATQQSER